MNGSAIHDSLWILVLAAAAVAGGCEIGTETFPTAADAPAADAPSIDVAPAQPPLRKVAPRVAPAQPAIARGKLRFIEGYRPGYAQAAAQHKPMLVFFTARWCDFCHQMADETFTDPRVVRLSERFVCILVDADREPDICGQFKVSGYPTIQFVSPRGAPLNRLVGKQTSGQLLPVMQSALAHTARRDAEKSTSAAR